MSKLSLGALVLGVVVSVGLAGCRDNEASSELDRKPLSDNSAQPKKEAAGGFVPNLDVEPAPAGVKTGTP
ncbi:MAG: hypothetical protein AMXMBFR81_03680 [Chthonomonas sp.]